MVAGRFRQVGKVGGLFFQTIETVFFLDESGAGLFLDEMDLSVDCVTGSLEKAHQVVSLLGRRRRIKLVSSEEEGAFT